MLLAVAAAAAASDCPPFESFTSGAYGQVSPAGRDGWVLSTDAGDGASLGSALPGLGLYSDHQTLRVRLLRLDADGAQPLELSFPGASFALRDGGWSVWESNAQFLREGWHDRPGLDTHQPHEVEIRQRGRDVELWLDGESLGRRTLEQAGAARIAIVVRARRGYRGAVWFSGFCAVQTSPDSPTTPNRSNNAQP